MKTDSILGQRVHEHLLKVGCETPMVKNRHDEVFQIEEIKFHVNKIMNILGLDMTDDSLVETPSRVAKMYVKEFFQGLDYTNFPKCTAIENKMDAGMVVERDIQVMSNCEHHLVVIDGVATVAYIPKDKVLGLSKLNRIVKFFSRRPQVQERLTNQIWHTLSFILGTDDVAVYVDASHYCVKARGIEDSNSSTITSRLGGAFLNDAACRAEFMSIARGN